jgi:1-acyl-sn-glycerol-3-phosphate acyltransferase
LQRPPENPAAIAPRPFYGQGAQRRTAAGQQSVPGEIEIMWAAATESSERAAAACTPAARGRNMRRPTPSTDRMQLEASPRLRRIAWTVLNALQLAFTLGWTAACITLALLVLPVAGRNRRLPLRMAARLWAPGLLLGAGAKLRVEDRGQVDFSRPHVFVSNHQSMIDICALFRALPVPLRFVMKQELARVPFVGWYARAMGMVFVERGRAREAARRLGDAVSLLRGGASLCAFPEGTRGRGDRVAAFKGGTFRVAIEAGVPVVPVAIIGSGAILPASGFRVRPGTLVVRIGEPVSTRGLRAHDRQQLARQMRDAVARLSGESTGDLAAPTPVLARRSGAARGG